MRRAGDDLILKPSIQRIELGTVSGHFHHQGLIFFRMLLCVQKIFHRSNIKLYLHALDVKERSDQCGKFMDPFIVFKGARVEF